MATNETEEDEQSIVDLCRSVPATHKLKKSTKRFLGDFIDRLKREGASKIAEAQDAERQANAGTRYDVNNYAGGPTTIRDVGAIKKRKRR